jgi:hypothetical protein
MTARYEHDTSIALSDRDSAAFFAADAQALSAILRRRFDSLTRLERSVLLRIEGRAADYLGDVLRRRDE